MHEIPYILSLSHKEKIDKVCKSLPHIGLDNVVMYILFNDGRIFVLSNVYQILKIYYPQDFADTKSLVEPARKGFYLCTEVDAFSTNLKKYNLSPIYNLVRHDQECNFVFSAIRKTAVENPQAFNQQTVKAFESFCIQFVDAFLDLIIEQNKDYRFSFIFNNKRLRDAVLRQGYEDDIALTKREQECIWYVGRGSTVKETAKSLNLSPYTVEQHLKRIRGLFNCTRIPEIMFECIHRGILGKSKVFHRLSTSHPDYMINNTGAERHCH